MNPWKILNIDPTSDKKIIKKAYALLIKTYSPDEHPEKFKEIQLAYQLALELSKFGIIRPIAIKDTPDIEKTFKTNEDVDVKVEINKSDLAEESDRLKKLLTEIDLVAHKQHKQPLNISHWKFIEEYHQVHNISLKEKFKEDVFRLVSNINLDCVKRNKPIVIPMRVIRYMSKVFNWEENWQDYKFTFSQPEYEMIFSQSDKDEETYVIQLIDLEERLKCFFSDLFSSGSISYIIILFKGISLFLFIKYLLLFFSSQRLFFEVISKASPGKSGNDARIVNTNGKEPSFLQIIFRHLIINISLFPVYAYIFERFLNYKIFVFNEYWDYRVWLPAFVSMIMLNIICYIFTKKLLHDLLTGTQIYQKVPEIKPIFDPPL
ncbi:MAG: DnaJ domain-containing protein [Xanthomonadales bacterium]|nr:DnaJ domain-containing protein [Xanthomonadales bacterium]